MPRVVCPLCRTGFEASISRENFALNCVTCGVAFSAASFLSKSDFSAKTQLPMNAAAYAKDVHNYAAEPDTPSAVFARPAANGTRTGGLPFMAEADEHTHAPVANSEPSSLPRVLATSEKKPAANLQVLRDKLQTIRVKLSENQARKPLGDAPQDIEGNGAEQALEIESSADECPVPMAGPVKAGVGAGGTIRLPIPAPVSIARRVSVTKENVQDANANVKEQAAVPEARAEARQDALAPLKALPILGRLLGDAVRPNPESTSTTTNNNHVADYDQRAADEKPKKKARRPLLEGNFGPYEIEGEIARGGVGAVFKARERSGGRQVALKVLLDGEEAGDVERERFRHECETAKALSLPGMVQVYEVGELEQRPYMAMELVNGRSLDKVIPEKTLSVNDCLVLMKSVAETIGALHEAGYVHRDLKPGNILIDAFGTPKVADFGLVKSLDEITRMTASGLVCGTPAYMAPEQARGDGKAVDPRSDVWALGAVLYEMLCARPPFQAENALRLMLKITKDQPKPLRVLNLKVPQDVDAIVMKCLEKKAEKRYPTGRALAADIGRFLNGEPIEVGPQAGLEHLQKFVVIIGNNGKRLAQVAGVLAALVVAGVFAHQALSPKDPNALVERGFKALSDPALKSSERIPTAERDFRDAIGLDGKNARAYRLLGLCLGRRGVDPHNNKILDEGKLNEARAMTLKAAELDSTMYGECRAQLARFDLWTRQPVEEAREWEKAVEFSRDNLKYREALAMAYWNAGAQLNSSQYYTRALNEFRAIEKADQSYPRVREYIKQLQERFLSRGSYPDATLSLAARNTAR